MRYQWLSTRVVRRTIKLLHDAAPNHYIRVRILGGVLRGRSTLLNLRYQMGYWLGRAETDLCDELQRSVAPGDVVFDVGAEIGYFSLVAASLSRTGTVFSFEPNPANIEILTGNVNLNPDLNIKVVSKAVGETRRQATFRTYDHASGVSNPSLLGRLSELADDHTVGESIAVDVIDLDSFCAQNAVNPRVVKIDVEGAEGLVIRGMQQLLGVSRPRLIVEVHSAVAESEVLSNLAVHRYRVRTIGRTYQTAYPYRLLCSPHEDILSGEGSLCVR